MLQYKIPSDVQVEDKILGPLTLKQLIIAAIGGGISYVIFMIASESFVLSIVDYFFIAIPFFLSLAFAFLRINDVSFLKFLLLLIEYMKNSKRRRWDKGPTSKLHYQFVTAKIGGTTEKEKQDKRDALKKAKSANIPGKKKFTSLEELTNVLDHRSHFSEADKTLPEDHDDDHALHLSAEEKKRHEERISGAIKKQESLPRPDSQPIKTTAPPQKNGGKIVDTVQKPSIPPTPPPAASPNQ